MVLHIDSTIIISMLLGRFSNMEVTCILSVTNSCDYILHLSDKLYRICGFMTSCRSRDADQVKPT